MLLSVFASQKPHSENGHQDWFVIRLGIRRTRAFWKSEKDAGEEYEMDTIKHREGMSEASLDEAVSQSERAEVFIKTVSSEDTQRLLEIYKPYVEETAITFEYRTPSLEEFQERIRRIKMTYPCLAAWKNGKIVGYAYASPFKERAAYDWAVETSIYICRTEKGKGIGKKLYGALEEALAAQNILNLNACIAYPEQEDEYLTLDSVRFHEKLGYRMVGKFLQCGYKFERWYHMVWMEKHIGQHVKNQPPILPFESVREELERKGILKEERGTSL